MKIGIFGHGRLGSAIAAAAAATGQAGDDARLGAGEPGDTGEGRGALDGLEAVEVVWQIGRGAAPEEGIDVAVDASAAEAVEEHLGWALDAAVPLVIGATGWTIDDLEARVGQRTGVLVAPNFSLTVALLRRLATVLGRFAAQDARRDPYVLELHHAGKRDAPSGTARMLAETLLAACPRKRRWKLGGPVMADELSVGAVRAGSEFGTHVVGLDAPAEVLEIHHRARSRAPFAEGALVAARWIRGKRGLYRFDDVAADLLDPLLIDTGGIP